MQLPRRLEEKTWGVTVLPPGLPATDGRRIGEIIHEAAPGDTLLIKHIFTAERLSIQVHPDDADARKRGLARGKTECWLVLAAEPGAVIGIGGKTRLTPDELAAMSRDGSIMDWLDWRTVTAGDFLMVPAGTIHAIGAGIALVEIQQNSDVTYRLFDYGRPRELHLGEGAAVARPGPWPETLGARAGPGEQCLVDGPLFSVRHVARPGPLLLADGASLVVPLAGTIRDGDTLLACGTCHRYAAPARLDLGDDAALLVARP